MDEQVIRHLESIINHVILPRGLPNKPDKEACDTALLGFLLSSVSEFSSLCSRTEQGDILDLKAGLEELENIRNQDGTLQVDRLRTASQQVIGQSIPYLPIYLQAQNAGLLVKCRMGKATFNIWGLTPNNETILKSTGRIVREFPECAALISTEIVSDCDFLEFFSQTLETMSWQATESAQDTRKRHSSEMVNTARNVQSPTTVTELLYIRLAMEGEPVKGNRLRKHTREEVICTATSDLPWRRSSFWLFLRVTMHLILSKQVSGKDILFKKFMVYFMARILDAACRSACESDTIHCIIQKICRRVRKLQLCSYEPWMTTVKDAIQNAEKLLEQNWNETIEKDQKQLTFASVNQSSIEEATHFTFPDLDNFIASMSSRPRAMMGNVFSQVSHLRVLSSRSLPPPFLLNDSESTEYKTFHLFMFEDWIDHHLFCWLEKHKTEENTCFELKERAISYFQRASEVYEKNPSELSAMILRLLVLWIACDSSAVVLNPSLAIYIPPVPKGVWNVLLLSSNRHMHQLFECETYLKDRHSTASSKMSVFATGKQSFSVTCFDERPYYQKQLTSLLKTAKESETRIVEDLERLKNEFIDLMEQYNQGDCDDGCDVTGSDSGSDSESNNETTPENPSCARCQKRAIAEKLDIEIYERRLPKEEFNKKTFVFELSPPKSFAAWRDMTVFLLRDVLASTIGESEDQTLDETPLPEYSKHYRLDNGASSTSVGSCRVVLSSAREISEETKVPIRAGLQKDDVFIDHPHVWRYCDTSTKSTIGTFCAPDIANLCTIKMPACATSLQEFIDPSPKQRNAELGNYAFNDLNKCPDYMSQEEYRSLASWPLGNHTRWTNIMRQLSNPTIDLNKQETALFLFEIVYQVGSSSDSFLRETHACLNDSAFTSRLLTLVKQELDMIKNSWEASTTLWTLIILLTRIASIGHKQTHQQAMVYLSECRNVSALWMGQICANARHQKDSLQSEAFFQKAAYVALICVQTFNVEETQLLRLLQKEKDAVIFLECSIVIADRLPSEDVASQPQGMLVLNWKRIICMAQDALIKQITSTKCLDTAISRTWETDRLDGKGRWEVESKHWVKAMRQSGASPAEETVQFNTLTAEILVNGSPSGRLPRNFENHPCYRTFFGSSRLDVTPCSKPGLQYQLRHKFEEHDVCLGLATQEESLEYDSESDSRSGLESKNDDFLLAASTHAGQYELIPGRLLCGLPQFFHRDHIHWLCRDHSDALIEFSTKESPWDHQHAILKLHERDGCWQLFEASGGMLVNPQSDVAMQFINVFGPLANEGDVHVIHFPYDGHLEIRLPQVQLEFFVERDCANIHSRQYPGMRVDTCQSIGTLIGLRNRLVLCDGDGERAVLVPEGQPRCEADDTEKGRPLSVHIDLAESRKVYGYDLNKYLGKLQGKGLESNLHLVLLHAFTSASSPDPFTGYTGTKRALEILRSAEVHSSPVLPAGAYKLLQNISNLSEKWKVSMSLPRPMRQTVVRIDGLSPLSHHLLFATIAQSLVSRCNSYRLFEPKVPKTLQKLAKDMSQDLCQRAQHRNSIFYLEDISQETFSDGDSYFQGHLDEAGLKKDDLSAEEEDGRRSCRFMNALVTSAAMNSSRIGQEQKGRNFINHFKNVSKLSFASVITTALKGGLDTVQVRGPSKSTEVVNLDYNAEHLLKHPSTFLPRKWFTLCHSLVNNRKLLNRHKAAFYIQTLAFSPHDGKALAHILAASFCMADVEVPKPPNIESFNLHRGLIKPRKADVKSAISHCIPQFDKCPHFSSQIRRGDSRAKEKQKKLREEYSRIKKDCVDPLVDAFLTQWDSKILAKIIRWPPGHDKVKTIVKSDKIISSIRLLFQDISNNVSLSDYFKKWHEVIHQKRGKSDIQFDDDWNRSFKAASKNEQCGDKSWYISSCEVPPTILQENGVFQVLKPMARARPSSQFVSLCETLKKKASTPYQDSYVQNLYRSKSALEIAGQEQTVSISWSEFQPQLLRHRNAAQQEVNNHLHRIRVAVYRQSSASYSELDAFIIATTNPLLPRINTWYLIRELGANNALPDPWKKQLVQFADCLTRLQALDRLLLLPQRSYGDIVKELQDLQPRSWDIMHYPEWLVFEVENNIHIRNMQGQFAGEMMYPADNWNSVMQLNMGEGKSSVVVPIVATALATGKNLVRLIVTRSQSTQMAQITTTRLGGLLSRRIYYLPVSRAMNTTDKVVKEIMGLLRECMQSRGVLIMQPEQVSALNLLLADSSKNLGDAVKENLYAIKQFMDDNCRDIIDESDEIFSPKYELVYPLGKEQPVDFARKRYCIIPQVLNLVSEFSESVGNEAPDGLIVRHFGPGRFPHLMLISERASDLLKYHVSREVCRKGLQGFPIHRQTQWATNKNLILEYITKEDPSEEARKLIDDELSWTPQMRSCVLLLRGLLAMNLLSAALADRFRVNYGLDKARQPRIDLAVPYRAKDTPSKSSEDSHPDVIIIKTSLAYYYNGLEDEDLLSTLKHLLQSDRAHMEYPLWVAAASELPEAWHSVKGISLEDSDACKRELFPHLRFLKVVVDYYLSHIVFPKQLKEYCQKVSISSWDIGRPKSLPTTGFSGTHDLEPLLPLPVKQKDHVSQRHVDALVLNKMLASQNSILLLGKPEDENISEEFLRKVTAHEPPLRVIVDVGAYLIDLTNEGVVRKWLQLLRKQKQDIKAAIYCDDHHELIVLDTCGKTETLRVSPFAKNMDCCVVFLDEAHSRGTDLRLPSTYRAAVTLGSNLTKDKLAQACMRMRKLGDGQFITYCIPHSIEHQIRLFNNQDTQHNLCAGHVICWTIGQTWADVRGSMPIWGKQGRQYAHQSEVWAKVLEEEDISLRRITLNELKETDVRTVQEQYQPHPVRNIPIAKNEIEARVYERLQEFQYTSASDLSHAEEREQQLEVEIEIELEEERQAQRTKVATPVKPSIHEDIKAFVITGKPRQHSSGIIGAFASLSDITAATKFNVAEFPSQLKVSKDFASVVTLNRGARHEKTDFYQRDVHHILTTADGSGIINNMILISPYEAEKLHDKIAQSDKVAMHIYAARRNSTYAPTDDLSLYVVPASAAKRQIPLRLKIELNLFAGQLYFDSFKEYVDVCTYLGLAWNESFTDANSDGFIPPKADGTEYSNCLNARKSPIPFLNSFITNVRHYGGNIEKTHMGKMLSGTFLTEEDFLNRKKRKLEDNEDEDRVVKREKLDEDQFQGQRRRQNRYLGKDVVVKREYDVEMEG